MTCHSEGTKGQYWDGDKMSDAWLYELQPDGGRLVKPINPWGDTRHRLISPEGGVYVLRGDPCPFCGKDL